MVTSKILYLFVAVAQIAKFVELFLKKNDNTISWIIFQQIWLDFHKHA